MIRKTVPNRPVLVANKGLKCPMHKARHYFEVDLDVTSDSAALFFTKMGMGMSKSIVVDMAFLIEGRSTEELPEQLMGTARFNRLDMARYRKIAKGESLGYETKII